MWIWMAVAWAEPATVWMVSDAVDPKLEGYVEKRLMTEAVVKAGAPVRGASLLRYPNECAPVLQAEELAGLSGVEGELYVGLPGASVKDTLLWRYDADGARLLRVLNTRSRQPPPVVDVPARLLVVPWPGLAPDAEVRADALALLSRESVQIESTTGFAGLVDALMLHPNECYPDIGPALTGQLADAAGADEELYVAVHVGGNAKHALLWRWDAESRRLSRVLDR